MYMIPYGTKTLSFESPDWLNLSEPTKKYSESHVCDKIICDKSKPDTPDSVHSEIYDKKQIDEANERTDASQQARIVKAAMDDPIGSPTLRELAAGKENVVIIASDHTRPVPSRFLIPPMLEEIRKGNPDAKITILIATGCHRGTTKEELYDKFGDIVYKEKIVVHDCDSSEMINVGKLPSGGDLIVNRLAYDADLLVAEGFIEPHFFAGFSGGRKSVLPGIASRQTVMYNHNAEFIDSPNARAGILDHNPIHEDMIFAAKTVGLEFILNVCLDSEKRIIHAVAGDVEKAHLAGCDFMRSHCLITAPAAPIVITGNGGYPLDQNLYQSVKGMSTAIPVLKEGGVLIMAAACNDGIGGDSFYKTFAGSRDPHEVMKHIQSTPKDETIVDQWQSQIFAKVLTHCNVVLISELNDDLVREMKMYPAKTMEDAMNIALSLLGDGHYDGLLIRDGVSAIVEAGEIL